MIPQSYFSPVKIGLNFVLFISLLVGVWLFFCPLRCALEYRSGTLALVLSVLIPLTGASLVKTLQRTLLNFTPGIVLAICVALIAHIILPSVPERCCKYKGVVSNSNYNAIAKELIGREAHAVINEDIETIEAIFTPNSIIKNEATGQSWSGASNYYQEKFLKEKHYELTHSALTVLNDHGSLGPDRFQITNASAGEWRFETDPCIQNYQNPPGSDLWTFIYRGRCCGWKVEKLQYNHQ